MSDNAYYVTLAILAAVNLWGAWVLFREIRHTLRFEDMNRRIHND